MTNRQRSERSREMLKAIQQIKSENYGLVGTKDVFSMIKQQRDLIDAPQIITGRINDEVRRFVPEPTYLATPKRLNGIYYVLATTNSDLNDFILQRAITKTGAPRFNIGMTNIFKSDESNVKNAVDYFLPFFMHANFGNVSNDEEIGSIVVDVLKTEYERVRDKLSTGLREVAEKMLTDLSAADWKEKTSKKFYLQEESEDRRMITEDTFNLNTMVSRVVREQTEQRLEYRRGILSHVLSEQSRQDLFLDLSGLPKTLKNLIGYYDTTIKSHRKALEELTNFRNGQDVNEEPNGAVAQYKESIQTAKELGNQPRTLDSEIEHYEQVLTTNAIIRRLLLQERNWVAKVLGN